jgi:U3 small nucleolar RNA-associated protein 22
MGGRPSAAPAHYKRRRVSAAGEYDAIALIRARDACADALGAPAVALALDALLASLRPPAAAVTAAHEALRALKPALDALPHAASQRPRTVADDERVAKTMRKVGHGAFAVAPYGFVHADLPVFQMGPPAEVTVVGSLLLGTSVHAPMVVDVAVQIPDGIVQPKDYLNHRYHDKRLLYLVCLMRYLRKHHADKFTEFAIGQHVLAHDPQKPLGSFSPISSPSTTIRLVPTIAEDTFDWEKLSEDRRNVRPSGASSISNSPTPSYNASIVMDARIVRHLKTMHAHVAKAPSFTDAVLMLRAWTTRRNLGGASGFVAAALLASTITTGAAPARATKEHLFRAALGLIRSGAMDSLAVDGVGIASSWDAGRRARWRAEAACALTALDAPGASEDPWAGVIPFLFATARGSVARPAPLCTLFDAFVTIKGDLGSVSPSKVLSVLDMALVRSGRVAHVEALSSVLYGLSLNIPNSSHDAYRKVDVRSEATDAAEFRTFWGPKAELRRFKDGRIVDSLVWGGGSGVLNEIVQYACGRHFGEVVRVELIMSQVEMAAGIFSADDGTSTALIAFNELSSVLRNVQGLPLSISSVLAISPRLRRCAVQPVRPHPKGKFLEPLDILAVFETSSAWPDDVLALASAKAAFYIAMKAGLAKLGIAAKACISSIDILLGGFAFRLRLRVDNEKNIQVVDKDALQRLVWETETRVLHHEAMRNISSPIFGNTARLFKRWLASHMLLCQFGDRAEELVEMLVARVFSLQHGRTPRSVFSAFCHCLHLLAEFPWEVAPLVVPLVKSDRDLFRAYEGHDSSAGGATEHEELEHLFASSLAAYKRVPTGKLHMHVANTHDETGEWFNGDEHKPERAALKRACTAASAALAYIQDQLTINSSVDEMPSWTVLFRTPVDGFDGMILVDNMWVPRSSKLAAGPLLAGQMATRLDTALVGFNPFELLAAELKRQLGDYALFLFDNYGGRRIFVVWRPSAKGMKPFSLQSLRFMKPSSGMHGLLPNKDEMVACIRRVCGSMVQRVDFTENKL